MATTATLGISIRAEASRLNIGLNFTGSTFLEDSFFIPPDTMGGVGSEHIVELINGRYSVYEKTTGTPVQTSSLNQFWSDAGVSFSSFAFDPRVLYDPFSERWFATSVDNPGSDNNFLLAVSNASDPTAGWTGFALDSDSTNQRWADFPTLGFDQDGVYVSANMFPISGRGAGGVTTTTVAVPKNDLLAATPTATMATEFGSVNADSTAAPVDVGGVLNPTTLENEPLVATPTVTVAQEATSTAINATIFENVSPFETGFTLQPVVDLDNTGLPVALLSAFNTPAGFFKRSNITGDITSPTLDTSDGFIPITPFGFPPNANQPGSKPDLDSGDNRFSSNIILHNGAFWGVQTVNNAGRAALRWFQIDATTNLLLQEGLIADPNLDFYYGSIAVNDFNDVVIGFSGSSENQFVSSYAALGQTVGGVTTFDTPMLLKEGVADYQRLDGIGRNRWGDYSATVIDPTDPFTFWTFQEFVSAEDQWSTQITELKIARATVPEPASVFGVLTFAGLGAASLKRKNKNSAQAERVTSSE
ncbi:PEP-CTERM sorting domain-containing protein [Coleofasciculus sp. E2-BRE-01]|uniref:PEP-CTERM sorting domain-containing protein n=1 Tax=Coleofasciculus sp. E2-BRE-01 TaxID=3069524 RepID=UPI0033012B4A